MTKKYTNRQPRTTSEQYLDDLSKFTEQSIDISSINGGNIVSSNFTVTSTAQEVYADSELLENRVSLQIINDSSFLVHYSLVDNPVLGEDTVFINSGVEIKFTFNPGYYTPVYLISENIDIDIKVREIQ